MTLLKQKFRTIGGWYDTALGSTIDFPAAAGDNWIQIVPTGKAHWVLACRGKDGTFVSIYDSLGGNSTKAGDHIIGCLSALLRTKEKSFSYLNRRYQQQLPNDCGVHAIVNAVTLARGANPSLTAYDRPKMWSHLKQCFVNNDLSAFTTSATKNNAVFSQSSKLKKAKVYCACRRINYTPDNVKQRAHWDVIECSKCLEWFHRPCEIWPEKTRGTLWLCKACKNLV